MTSIYLENGGRIGVYGDVEVEHGKNGWTVNMTGPVVKAEPPGIMGTLRDTVAVSITPDEQPGHVVVFNPMKTKPSSVEYLQIPPGTHTTWMLFEDDAEPVK